MDKMQLWHSVEKTDFDQVKPITGKQYQGNSPKPYYIVRRLTETFGPCGIGWGFAIVSERMERLSETEVLHIAHVRFWYELDGKRGEVEQMGQTKATYERSKGGLMVDEDAPKKSVTDALVKAASYLGFAGDIFSGRWDDSKYVAELRREADQRAAAPPPPRGVIKATDGAENAIGEDAKALMEEVVLMMIDHDKAGNPQLAADIWYDPGSFSPGDKAHDEKVYAWKLLARESKLRAYIKAHTPYDQKKAA